MYPWSWLNCIMWLFSQISIVVMFRSSAAPLNLSFVGSRIGNNRLQERRHHRKDTSCAAGEQPLSRRVFLSLLGREYSCSPVEPDECPYSFVISSSLFLLQLLPCHFLVANIVRSLQVRIITELTKAPNFAQLQLIAVLRILEGVPNANMPLKRAINQDLIFVNLTGRGPSGASFENCYLIP